MKKFGNKSAKFPKKRFILRSIKTISNEFRRIQNGGQKRKLEQNNNCKPINLQRNVES